MTPLQSTNVHSDEVPDGLQVLGRVLQGWAQVAPEKFGVLAVGQAHDGKETYSVVVCQGAVHSPIAVVSMIEILQNLLSEGETERVQELLQTAVGALEELAVQLAVEGERK